MSSLEEDIVLMLREFFNGLNKGPGIVTHK